MRVLLSLLFFFTATIFAKQGVFIEGYLGQEQVSDLQEKFKTIEGDEITIIVESNGGAFFEVLRMCQSLQKYRSEGKKVTMLLNKRAIGPAAFLPFVADTLYVVPGSVWGNIPYGLDNSIPRDVMMDAARGLIPSGKDERTKEQIAEAMIDPYSQVSGVPFTSDPLILSSEQIVALGYGKMVDSETVFLAMEQVELPKGGASSIALYQVKDVVSRKDLISSFETNIHFDSNQENYIGYIRLKGAISKAQYLQTKFAIQKFRSQHVVMIVLDLDVSGGDIFSAIMIGDLLEKTDANDRIPIFAYLNNRALSAGALLPYACRYIIANKQSVIGASEGKELNTMYATLKSEFARAAGFWGRNPVIAEAMVDQNDILVLRNHSIEILRNQSQVVTTGADPDVLLSNKGELFTLQGESIYDLGVASAMVQEVKPLSKEEVQEGSWPASLSPIFSLPYLATAPSAIMLSYSSWKVSFFSVLTSAPLLALLFFGLMVGFYLELNTPGFGIMGTIGLVCFSLIIWGNATVHSIHWAQWAILLVGLLFFAVELFFIPGFGWTGITGIVFILLALASFSLPNVGSLDLMQWDTFSLVFTYVLPQVLWIVSGLVTGGILIYLIARFVSKKVLNLSKLTLHGNTTYSQGNAPLDPEIPLPEIGSLGEAFTPLKPSGQVRIGDEIYDAVTQTGFIDKEAPITVVRIDGYKLVVRLVGEEE